MYYRGPGFLVVVYFGSLSSPPLPSADCLSFSVFLCVALRAYWRERGVGKVEGAKSYDGEKASSSIIHEPLPGIWPSSRSEKKKQCRSSWSVCSLIVECLVEKYFELHTLLVMSMIPKRKYRRSDIEANYWNETKTFWCVPKKEVERFYLVQKLETK